MTVFSPSRYWCGVVSDVSVFSAPWNLRIEHIFISNQSCAVRWSWGYRASVLFHISQQFSIREIANQIKKGISGSISLCAMFSYLWNNCLLDFHCFFIAFFFKSSPKFSEKCVSFKLLGSPQMQRPKLFMMALFKIKLKPLCCCNVVAIGVMSVFFIPFQKISDWPLGFLLHTLLFKLTSGCPWPKNIKILQGGTVH